MTNNEELIRNLEDILNNLKINPDQDPQLSNRIIGKEGYDNFLTEMFKKPTHSYMDLKIKKEKENILLLKKQLKGRKKYLKTLKKGINV